MAHRHGSTRRPRPGPPQATVREPLLSACLIVRDEADMLPACLESLVSVADEVVVVDTGSADGTPEIARRAGARVYAVEWRDDFAAARNAGLARARGRWVLQIDADERLVAVGGGPPDALALRRLLSTTAVDPFQLGVRSVLDAETGVANVGAVLRLFRRRPGRCFVGRIHEQISDPGGARIPPPHGFLGDVELLHLGYLPDVQRRRRKRARNMRLCALAAAERPEDPVMRYHYGWELYEAGSAAAAVTQLRQAWDRMPVDCVDSTLWWLVVIRTCEVWNASGHAGETLARVEGLLTIYPDVPHLHLLRGDAVRLLGSPQAALDILRHALSLPPSQLPWQPAQTRPWCWNCVGLAHEQMGQPEQAVQAYRRSLALVPTDCARDRLAALGVGPTAP